MFDLRSKTKWYCPPGKWFYGPTPLPSGISWASDPPTPLEFPIPSVVGVWIFSGTTQCHFLSFSFWVNKISCVIGKAQCLCTKKWWHTDPIKEVTSKTQEVSVSLNLMSSDRQTLLQRHWYHHPCAYVQICKRAQSLDSYGIIKA